MPKRQVRHLIVLAAGFSVSIVASSTFVGAHVAYHGLPLVQQILITFLLPTTASAIYLVLRSLQRRQLMLADAMTPDPAVQTIVFWILLFLIAVHVMVLAVLFGVRALQPWASRAVVMLLGLTLVAIGNLGADADGSRSLDAHSQSWRLHLRRGRHCHRVHGSVSVRTERRRVVWRSPSRRRHDHGCVLPEAVSYLANISPGRRVADAGESRAGAPPKPHQSAAVHGDSRPEGELEERLPRLVVEDVLGDQRTGPATHQGQHVQAALGCPPCTGLCCGLVHAIRGDCGQARGHVEDGDSERQCSSSREAAHSRQKQTRNAYAEQLRAFSMRRTLQGS